MNAYRFSDLSVGMEISFDHLDGEGTCIEITPAQYDAFRRLTGDVSPIHVDEAYARTRGFRSRVCYGMLVSAYYSTLVGVYLPGKYALFQEAHIFMTKPVFVGDRLTVTGKIKELNNALKRVTIKARIRNQDGETVSRATLEVGMSE